MGCDLGRGAVGEARRLEGAARLVERVAGPLRRERAAGGGAGRSVYGLERRAGLAGELERVALAAVDDRAEELSPSDRVRRHNRGTTLARQILGERRLSRRGVTELEGEDHRQLADAERRQAIPDVVRGEATG